MEQQLSGDMFEKIKKIEGWLWDSEIGLLYFYASHAVKELQRGEILVEIGSWQGRSTVTIGLACKEQKKGHVLAIDPYDRLFVGKQIEATVLSSFRIAESKLKKNISRFALRSYIQHIPLSSHKAYSLYRLSNVRFLFIDGDHNYDAVYFDTYHWTRALVNGGYLLLHDTLNHSGPRTVFYQLLLNPRYVYRGTTGDMSCFQKMPYISPGNWICKIYGYVIFRLFFNIYRPNSLK
jgi:hypothetical protein